ncbi:MAG TPA: GTPase ObgE [Thermoanaerobaculales bacterium]|nr:GTPase ObgE [Thermoanaerobaculales bacterium]HPA79249.1 GTPase ObgE [Thermoanaerobaculales bacterium]HQL29103.1 GTPase ObgE [Thermoanaerobaculales bacterium]HQN96755.1 GTPase ObgE [Thermoanaerobaculales bacterium]
MFIDSARMTVRAGDGGRGCVAFRREKYVPRGGPSGGDGGAGGSVVLVVDSGYNTLLHVHHRRLIKAARGEHGQGSTKTGADGSDIVVAVPPGTVVRDAATGELLGDLVAVGQRLVVARGGRGGRGNARFATPTNRAPRRAEPGAPGEERELSLELKLMADLGLVGMPNAGKSTLLSRISAARPKVADYPFTTLEPCLGVVRSADDEFRTMVVADIPGLIEGAHQGAGLGVQFLRHVERCRALAHLADLTDPTPLGERVATIRAELESYSAALHRRAWLLVGTKLDAVADREASLAELAGVAGSHGVASCAISAVTGEGLERLVGMLFHLIEEREHP